MKNPFDILGVQARFDLDLKQAEKNHRELSRALHPDRYTGAGASERRDALSRAVEVNEAWRVVRDPIRRAEALFALSGVPVGETKEPKPGPELLMDIMEQREALSEAKAARDMDAVRKLAGTIDARAKATEKKLADGLAKDPHAAIALLGELRFYKRFLDEVSAIEDHLAEAV